MKIMVTGNLGYIGPLVGSQLRSSFPECELIGVDLGLFEYCLTDTNELSSASYNSQKYIDVRDLAEEDCAGFDAIVHLAAISNDPMGEEFAVVTKAINLEATKRLAENAKKAGVKSFVFASSCSVYGAGGELPKKETDALNPLTEYAKSKVEAEQYLKTLASEDFKVTCLRFATACGYSKRTRLDLVLNDFVASAITSSEIIVLSDGTPWRPLIHVSDMAKAMDWAIGREGSNYLVVNAGSDEWNYQVKDLALAVAKCIPSTRVSINQSAPPDKRSYRVDFSSFREAAPDHQPKMSLEDTIRELIDGLSSPNLKLEGFRESNLIRLNQLREHKKLGHVDTMLKICRPKK